MVTLVLKSRTTIIILFGIIGILTCCFIYIGIVTHPTSDANYYISIARDVFDGYVPTYNVDTEYTPLVYYILAFFFWVVGNSNHVTAIISVELFSLSNVLLIYYLMKKKLELDLFWSLLFTALYIFSLIRLTSFQMFLEPFQVFFALLSFILLTSKRQSFTRIVFSGLLMGLSIMCKQYSALFAIGIGIWMVYAVYKKDITYKKLIYNGSIWCISLILPYLAFIVFTEATLSESLISFGFIGDAANNYAAIKPSFFKLDIISIAKVVALHALELFPFFVYPIYRRISNTNKNITNIADGIFLLGLLALVTIYVRQYAHYFQLISPWAILLWALMISDYLKHFWDKQWKNVIRHSIIISFILAFPTVFYMSPKLFYYHVMTNVIQKKSYEIDFMEEALQVFKNGSMVYVRGNSLLYVSCNYRNPTHNYYFTSPIEMLNEGKVPDVIDNIVIPKLPTQIYIKHKDFFISHGFQILKDAKYGLYLTRIN